MPPLGIVVALRAELAPALRPLKAVLAFHQGFPVYRSAGLRCIVAGVGRERAAAAARALCSAEPLSGLVSAGFAGALTEELRTGDLVLGGCPDHPADPALLERARASGPYADGDVACVEAVLNEAARKRELARRSGARVVDMESAAVAEAAREAGRPFLAAKAVLDTPDAPLAGAYGSCLAVLWTTLTRPGGVMRDAKRSRVAAERLKTLFTRLDAEDPPY
jgi:nucleoside phosphorylase